MRTQFIDITIPGNTNLGGYDTQVIPDQVHDRGMLRRFLGIIEDTSPGIGQRSVDRTFHGIRIDETIPRPHEYLRREYHETIPHPKLIHRLGMVKDIFQGEVRIYRSSACQVHQIRITRMDMPGNGLERMGILLERDIRGLPFNRFSCDKMRGIPQVTFVIRIRKAVQIVQ